MKRIFEFFVYLPCYSLNSKIQPVSDRLLSQSFHFSKAKQRQEMELQTLQSYAQSKGFDGDLEIYDVDYWVRRQRNSILGMFKKVTYIISQRPGQKIKKVQANKNS